MGQLQHFDGFCLAGAIFVSVSVLVAQPVGAQVTQAIVHRTRRRGDLGILPN